MSTGTYLFRQRFEIAAAHRLAVLTKSDAENREVFGKCANPHGHGHNYVIEPCVEIQVSAAGLTAVDLERAVDEAIIQPFDHKFLNVECAEFDQSRGGVNPSVENISRVFYERLRPLIEGAGARLRHVTVWETEKTSSTYPG